VSGIPNIVTESNVFIHRICKNELKTSSYSLFPIVEYDLRAVRSSVCASRFGSKVPAIKNTYCKNRYQRISQYNDRFGYHGLDSLNTTPD
jgi:hypothetical protein